MSGRRVFVVGAYMPAGGTYMAYHVGRIVATHFGYEPIAVQVRRETADTSLFEYPDPFDMCSLRDLIASSSKNDVLICNPSFSDHQLGRDFPGRSLMYVQGVNTYRVIDGFFDHYVAVSRFVRDHLALHYGWDVPVVPPFVHAERIGTSTPWSERPPASILAFPKSLGNVLLDELLGRLLIARPDITVDVTTIGKMPHHELLTTMQRHRYFLALSPLEGHPLTPIEAMLSGCCVVGFHGGGGMDFLQSGVNSAVVGYPRVDAVCDALAGLLDEPARAGALAQQGKSDAKQFDYAAFEQRWCMTLERFIGRRA